ncbi:hypothetical protein [Pontibaca methylaminivorans]|uniref:ABC transporter permease n=1 Tax=Pontibaca methylaminivorans TaxID=515897 RepID=A0A1R3W7T9_9RHOB|nr:hypothetical protein [Pontibaca methylaminivorans]SIT73984.1 hypothetical protein SAMN05421849_0077 [Pontibaca methylaminivorans]
MNIERWFLRMALWARRPPSARRVVLVLAIILACGAIIVVERAGYWPDWATAERMRP